MHAATYWQQLADRALSGDLLTREAAHAVLSAPDESLRISSADIEKYPMLALDRIMLNAEQVRAAQAALPLI